MIDLVKTKPLTVEEVYTEIDDFFEEFITPAVACVIADKQTEMELALGDFMDEEVIQKWIADALQRNCDTTEQVKDYLHDKMVDSALDYLEE
jgi:hypothetical protein